LRTDLQGANLTGANLSGADLSSVNLTGAKLKDTILTGIKTNKGTISNNEYFLSVIRGDGKKKKRLVKKSVINESIGIEGYKDFKFGMTYDQIKATGICEGLDSPNKYAANVPAEGCYKVAGKKRFIRFYFTSTELNDLKSIEISLGESTKEYFNKLVKGIGKKYKETYRLTKDQQFSLNKGNMIVFFADGRITLREDLVIYDDGSGSYKWIDLIYTREVSPYYKKFEPKNVSTDDF
jgi:hypothetical protein